MFVFDGDQRNDSTRSGIACASSFGVVNPEVYKNGDFVDRAGINQGDPRSLAIRGA